MPHSYRKSLLVVALIALAGCSSAEKAAEGDSASAMTEMTSATAAAAVQILTPSDGDSVSLPFTVTLGATGVEVIAANGMHEEGKGHHHLIIDGDAPESDSLPLAAAPVVIHMGTGATERVFDSLAVGPHRIIAVFADGNHVPWANVARDTVNVVVR